MATEDMIVDFRMMTDAQLHKVRAGFRSVIHRAYYSSDADLDFFFRGFLKLLLPIDEVLQKKQGTCFAAGAALAHRVRQRDLKRHEEDR